MAAAEACQIAGSAHEHTFRKQIQNTHLYKRTCTHTLYLYENHRKKYYAHLEANHITPGAPQLIGTSYH